MRSLTHAIKSLRYAELDTSFIIVNSHHVL